MTTSMWFSRMIGRCASAVVCGTRAHRSPRPGAYSKTRFSMPSWSRIFLKNAAARISLPGGLVVSMRRYSCFQCTARSAYCFMRSAGMRDDAIAGDGPFAGFAARRGPADCYREQRDATSHEIADQKLIPALSADIPKMPSPNLRFSNLATQFLYQLCQNYPARDLLTSFPAAGATMSLISSI